MESLVVFQLFRDRSSASKVQQLLNDPDENGRVRAAFSLGKIGGSERVPPLIEALSVARSTAMKKSAIAALGYIGDRTAADAVIPYLKDDDEAIRVTAAGALGLMGNRDGLQTAIKGCDSMDLAVKRDAIIALGFIGGTEAKTKIEELLKTPDSRWKSYQLISKHRMELEDDTRQMPVMDKIGRLKDLLDNKNKRLAQWAVEQLGEIGSSNKFKKEERDEAIKTLKEKRQEDTKIGLLSERQLRLLKVKD